MIKDKKLYRSQKNKIFAGILGGLGEYFEVDPVALRVLWILLIGLTGFVPGIVAYIVAIFVVPKHR
ncbi:PspC domain-containing protein [Patescibacteria group bacterium]